MIVYRGLVNSIMHMLIDLGINSRIVYEEDFEKQFLETSANFYRLESQEFIAANSCSDYMKKVCFRHRERRREREENTILETYNFTDYIQMIWIYKYKIF